MISGNGTGMITILRNNKSMLRRKRLFKKERTFLGIQPNFKEVSRLTPDLIVDIEAVANERHKARKAAKRKLITTSCIFILVCAITGLVLSMNSYLTVKPLRFYGDVDTTKTIIETSYLHFVDSARRFRISGDYELAKHEVKKAFYLNSIQFDAHMELYRIYKAQCINDNLNCDLAKVKEQYLRNEFSDFMYIDFNGNE